MTQYKLLPATSPAVALEVAVPPPAPVITGITWPQSPAVQGSTQGVEVSWRNDGADGLIFLRLLDFDTGVVLDSFTQSVIAGETGITSLLFTMPAKDISLFVEIGYDTTVSDNRGPQLIELLIEIGTSVTLTLSPTKIEPGGTVTWSGKLSRADGLDPGVQTIFLYHSAELWAQAITDAFGNYDAIFKAPLTAGIYYLEAVFEGAMVAGVLLKPSSKAVRLGVTERPVDIKSLLFKALPLAAGAVIVLKARA